MSKQTLLSIEISKGRALLLGGGAISEFTAALRQWTLSVPRKGMSRVSEGMLHWNESLEAAMRDSARLGAPVAALLREIQPLVHREEKSWARLQALEKQMAFQGAIALVLPWTVIAINGNVTMNVFTVAGALVQLVGLTFFYWLVKRSLSAPRNEQVWLFRLLVGTWMRVLAGFDVRTALGAALGASNGGTPSTRWASPYRQQWNGWLTALDAGTSTENFVWISGESADVAHSMGAIIRGGAPAAALLSDYVSQMDDQRQSTLEEKIASLPVRLSLLLCFLFTPAVFLILFGGLWPQLSALTM